MTHAKPFRHMMVIVLGVALITTRYAGRATADDLRHTRLAR
jgi:hypothetical protein